MLAVYILKWFWYNFSSNWRFTSCDTWLWDLLLNFTTLSAILWTYLRGNLLSSSLETKVVLAPESKRMCKSCYTDCMQLLRMHKLFCDSSCIVKNETIFSTSFSDSTLFITSNSQSHNIRYFNTSDLFMKSSEFMRLCKEVFYHCSTVALKIIELSLFLTCTCDCSFPDCEL